MTLLNLLRPRLAAAAVFALLERYKKDSFSMAKRMRPLLLPLFLGENHLSEPVSDFEEAEDAHAGAEAKEAA